MRQGNRAHWQLTLLAACVVLCVLAALASCGRPATSADPGIANIQAATATSTATEVPTATTTVTPFPTEAFNGTPYTSQYGTPPPTPPPPPAPTATPTPKPTSVDVDIVSSGGIQFGFSPATLSIKVGTTVVWVNQTGAPHTSTSDSGVWSSPIIAANGGTFSFKFTAPGTFSYHCSIHPYMQGTITVTA